MDRASKYALDAAKDITVARMANTTISPGKQGGENVAEFFEAIYNKIFEIAKNATE